VFIEAADVRENAWDVSSNRQEFEPHIGIGRVV
jgi:hypothetical protein